jgi:hypothetical protein
MKLLGIRQESVRQIRLSEGRGHLTAFVYVVMNRLRICML